MPLDVKPVVAKSAGRAIGIIRRDRNAYAGIVLDHDLQARSATSSDRHLCGQDVVDVIVQTISRDIPILVHSVNETQGPVMERQLLKAGFAVERIPMHVLTEESFNDWIEYVSETWLDLHGDES